MGTPMKMEDDATKGTGASPDSERSPATGPQGMHRREAYCLLVWVARNVDSVSALDAKVPDYVWAEVIAWDICTYQIGAPPGTFIVELLSDMEFLLFQGPRSSPGMAWEDTIHYIRALHDIQDWGGMEVTMVIGQRTMRQSQIDLANTREYRRTWCSSWRNTPPKLTPAGVFIIPKKHWPVFFHLTEPIGETPHQLHKHPPLVMSLYNSLLFLFLDLTYIFKFQTSMF